MTIQLLTLSKKESLISPLPQLFLSILSQLGLPQQQLGEFYLIFFEKAIQLFTEIEALKQIDKVQQTINANL